MTLMQNFPTPTQDRRCPHCGYCPTCGQSRNPCTDQYWKFPVYPYCPPYQPNVYGTTTQTLKNQC